MELVLTKDELMQAVEDYARKHRSAEIGDTPISKDPRFGFRLTFEGMGRTRVWDGVQLVFEETEEKLSGVVVTKKRAAQK